MTWFISDRNVFVLQMFYMREQQEFSSLQLMAMLLTKLKQTAEIALKTKVVDAVVSVSAICILGEGQRKRGTFALSKKSLDIS